MNQTQPRKKFGPLEAMLTAFGLFSLGSGLVNEDGMQIFWGVCTLSGMVILFLLRRKDWNRHWQEMEEQSRRKAAPAPRQDPPAQS